MEHQSDNATKGLLGLGSQDIDPEPDLPSDCAGYRPDDVSTTWSYGNKKGFGLRCRRCFSWINFGLLCLLIGALGGYLLRVYLDQKFEGSLFGNKRLDEAEFNRNSLPLALGALKQQESSNQKSKKEDEQTVATGTSQSKEGLLLDKAVREILENMTGVRGLPDIHLKDKFNLTKDPSQRIYLSVGMRNDYTLQACGENKLKQSFPDVDYALFGYNVLKGFPLAVGHDPGFTLPIFRADYSTGAQSADCRYSIPRGLAIVPDVSCVTSFTSEIVSNEHKLRESLSVSAGVSGGGWGVSFSASGGYKKATEDLSKNSKTYIISTAKCNYYFSKLIKTNAPPFNPDFLDWIIRLETAKDENTFIDFFEMFGTHFQTEVSFGARYSYEHIMTKDELEKKEKEGMNVAMAASYSGLFSVGGHFALDREKEEMRKSFSEKIETKTVTVGAAPPADGDAMKWASSVQSNPVPVYYRLSSIENLFTNEYMDGLNVNYTNVYDKIVKYKSNYKKYLIHKHHFLDNCNKTGDIIVINKTRLIFHNPHEVLTSNCIEECHNNTECKAVSKHTNKRLCWLYRNGRQLSGEFRADWTTYFLRKDMKERITLRNTAIHGTILKRLPSASLHECMKTCLKHYSCLAFNQGDSKTCELFGRDGIKNLYTEHNTTTFFVSHCAHKDLAVRRT